MNKIHLKVQNLNPRQNQKCLLLNCAQKLIFPCGSEWRTGRALEPDVRRREVCWVLTKNSSLLFGFSLGSFIIILSVYTKWCKLEDQFQGLECVVSLQFHDFHAWLEILTQMSSHSSWQIGLPTLSCHWLCFAKWIIVVLYSSNNISTQWRIIIGRMTQILTISWKNQSQRMDHLVLYCSSSNNYQNKSILCFHLCFHLQMVFPSARSLHASARVMDSGNGTSDIVRNKSGLREQVHFSRNTSSWSGPNHVFRNNTTYFSLRLLVVLVGGGAWIR